MPATRTRPMRQTVPATPTMPPVRHDRMVMRGGWDQETPSLDLPPGVVRDAQNFEIKTTGGYRRIAGYERFDGQPAPSAASYSTVKVTSFTTVPTLGVVATQAVSGATGVVIAVDEASLFFVITKVTGTWDTTNSITQPGPVTIGTATSGAVSLTEKQKAQYKNLAGDEYRDDIGAVPGSGPVRGVCDLIVGGDWQVFAFRDNAGGTAVDLYKATASGWVQVTLFNEVSFTAGGTTMPTEGSTLTQGGVTATIKRTVTQTGAWSGSDAAGRFIIDTPAGGNFSSGAATIGGISVTLSGAETAITLSVGGKYTCFRHNFAGQASTIRIYGADGANRMFEFDGTVYVPITSGASTDAPKHITAFKNHLFYSVASSAFFSAPGDPYRHAAADNAGELPVGDEITGFMEQPGAETVGALAIYAENDTGILYGTGLSDWNFSKFQTKAGAYHYTVQELDQTYALDPRGVFDLGTSLNYGNFINATLTETIKTYITNQRSKVVASAINRDRSQYRLFFNDGEALYITILNGQVLGSMPQTFPDIMYVVHNTENASGDERTFLGANSSGYVYQLDIGPNFDGANIAASLTFNWHFLGNPRIKKRFRHASLEVSGEFYASISFGYRLGYGLSAVAQPGLSTHETSFTGGPSWDSFTWDNFTWDGLTLSPTEISLVGTGENIEITVTSDMDYIQPYTINSLILDYTERRRLR